MKQQENTIRSRPCLIIVMGVSGSGKSTVAKKLAVRSDMEFMEADDFHSQEAKAHMAKGKPLNDIMREPWISNMLKFLECAFNKNKSVVLSYSGLKRLHRQRFRSSSYQPNLLFIFLEGSKQLITERMINRIDHFMPAALLDSQFAAMEMPDKENDIVTLDIDSSVNDLVSDAEGVVSDYFKQ